jgi:leucine dehydrogenase
VAVQGLGHVGWHLCRLLHAAGADLVVADMNAGRAARAAGAFDAAQAEPEEAHAVAADVFAPCAIGGILNATTVPQIRAGLVAGAANNQLAAPERETAQALHARGILYLPDYVANGGGIINAAAEILAIADRQPWVAEKLAALESTMARILDRAAAEGLSPAEVADRTVEEMMLKAAG